MIKTLKIFTAIIWFENHSEQTCH